MTVRELLTEAYELVGVLAEGETLSASQASTGVKTINNVITSWSTQGLMLDEALYETFPLTNGKLSYTIGVGGDFETGRPIELISAGILVLGTPDIRTPLRLLTKEEYAEITSKDLQGTIPSSVWYNPESPNGVLYFWPVPSSGYRVELFYRWPFPTLAIDATMGYSPGYERLLLYEAAEEIGIKNAVQISPLILQKIVKLKADIMRTNIKPVLMTSDVVGLVGPQPMANIYSGDS